MRHVTVQHGQEEHAFEVPDVENWEAVAQYLVSRLIPGDIVTLSGPLGAGKTTFVQALAQVMGTHKNPQSPTFALMRSYPLKNDLDIKRLLHVDAYRIESPRELLALDLDEELSDGKTVLVLEWPEKIGEWVALREKYRVQISS